MTPFPFDNTYANLPAQFYSRTDPVAVKNPKLIKINLSLANDLGVDGDFLASNHGVDILAGNKIADGSTPIAMAYGGHQFGNWAGRLGDGRAIYWARSLIKMARVLMFN